MGGNTSCVAVWPEGERRPRLLLDAGTGIRDVTALCGDEPFRGTIVLSHLHWDHVQGLPFFAAGDRPDARVELFLPGHGRSATGLLARAMSPPHFPIGPEGLQGHWSFSMLDEGTRVVEGLSMCTTRVRHKGGRTYGYRLSDALGSMAYVPDHLLTGRTGNPSGAVTALIERVDVLVHDAQFDESESDLATEYGHSTVDQVAMLANRAGVGELVLFHHSPSRTDADIGAVLDRARSIADCPVRLAIEGLELSVCRSGPTTAR